jgi:hypothetical protein
MGEKTQIAAHIEAQDRHPMAGQMTGSPEHGAITTQHQVQDRARLVGWPADQGKDCW